MKGAPDLLLARCRFWLSETGERPLTEGQRQKLLLRTAALSKEAYRVLGAAKKAGDGRGREGSGVSWPCGDDGSAASGGGRAVELFRQASVRTVMITGDHKDTAFAIAKKLSIADSMPQCVSGGIWTA